MKIKFIILAVALSAALFSGCSTRSATRSESQFANRLEYLRFCQTTELLTSRCD